jgi:hypothetical protein
MNTVIWQESKNRRNFFENYALENGFDPLIAANWYSLRRENIINALVYFF